MQRHTVRVTTGVIVEQDGKILMVDEPMLKLDPSGKLFLTHPSGHIEAHESVLESAVRECLEETGYEVELMDLVGVYETNHPSADYIRFSFRARLKSLEPIAKPTDPDVVHVMWLSREELEARRSEWRPGATTESLQDYFAGKRYSLDFIRRLGKIGTS